MIVDTENNYIYLAETPNSHLLIMGQSGSGKTYYCNRKIEQEIQKGKGVLIFDYSGSFTVNELKRANFAYCAQVNYKNPIEDEVVSSEWENILRNMWQSILQTNPETV